MSYTPHSRDQYNLLFHHAWCEGRGKRVASQLANMNETHAWRAMTGWASGKDGKVGREAFIDWLRGATSGAGAPCCGAHLIPGKRPLPDISAERLEMSAALRDVENRRWALMEELGMVEDES